MTFRNVIKKVILFLLMVGISLNSSIICFVSRYLHNNFRQWVFNPYNVVFDHIVLYIVE
jgi:hypothetical protein